MKPSFVILGARGTMPVSGREFLKYGGHTTCFCLKTGEGNIVVDAGTGIDLLDESKKEQRSPMTLLFTHFHLDHVMALPSLERFYNAHSSVRIMADYRRSNWRSALANLAGPPYWPIRLVKMKARVAMVDLPDGTNKLELYGIQVSWCRLSHPQGCLAYRFDTPHFSVAVATDHECGDRKHDKVLSEFCQGVDNLIFDSTYLPAELKDHRGWGHSTWEQGVAFARAANAGELILTHHNFKRRDEEIDAIVKNARRRFPKTKAASDAMVIF